MDRTGKLIMFASVALLIAGFIFQSKMTRPKPPQPTGDSNDTNAPGPTVVEGNGTATNAPVIGPNTNTNAAPVVPSTNVAPVVNPPEPVAVSETTEVLENQFVRYTFTSRGGGVASVELIERDEDKKFKYPRKIGDDKAGPVLMELDRGRLPLLAWQPGTGKAPGNAPNADRPYVATPAAYKLEKFSDTEVSLTASFGAWKVEKTFTIGKAYQLSASVRVSNTSTDTLAEAPFYLMTGTAHEPIATNRMMGLGYGTMWYDGEEETAVGPGWFDNYRMGCACFGSAGARNNYQAGAGTVRWIGGYSRFFIQAVMPEEAAHSVNINRFRMDSLTPEQAQELGINVTDNQDAFETSIQVKIPSMPPNGVQQYNYTLYTGPREYDRLTAIGKKHGNNQFHRIMDFGTWFGWVAEALLRIMKWFEPKLNFLSSLTISGYAMAIIAITFIIKLIFWPITAKSTRAMKKMAAVNAKMMPEINKIREKYSGDYQKMNLKMMEVYKKYGVNPLSQMGGCLPLLIQIPVFFGFFTMLRSAVELRGAEFLWVTDLSSADTIAHIAGFPINILPLFMTGTMFLQMKMQPPSPTMDPTQQAIMKYMPLMFVFILYSASAGLCLYWTVQNVLSIVQTKMTKIDPEEDNAVEVIPPDKPNKKRKR